MRKVIFIFLGILYLSINSFAQETEQKVQQKSIAVLLNFQGKGNIVSNISVSMTKVYEGRAKDLNSRGSTRATYPIKVVVLDADKKQIFEGFFDSPLVEKRESFAKNGQDVDNFEFEHTEGILSVRFPLTENSMKEFTMLCYQVDGDEH